ncbi:MAG: hypothetical protein ACJA0Q_001539 [Saprospiraceae bacterium]
MKKSILSIFTVSVSVVFIVLSFSACKKDKISNDSSHKLSFSLDILSFDTLFSTVGSSTRIFKIYNPNDEKVKISSISLGGGSTSFFRVNLNGKSAVSFADIELRANDSLWVFAEVTIDPSNSNNPFLVKDSLVLITNGNIQQVNFEAFGQDVYFHKPTDGTSSYELTCGETWKSDKPHLVFGTAIVDTNCQLTIEAGSKVYFHANGGIQVMKGATLQVNGTRINPVYFEGDRLEPWYSEVAGQWLGIYLEDESVDHELSFLHLKNAQIGLFCKADIKANTAALLLDNCSFINCAGQGLYFQSTSVQAYNLLVGNCISNELLIEMGGTYDFKHATFANYVGANAGASSSGNSVFIKNWGIEDGSTVDNSLEKCDFYNSIIYGSERDELTLSDNGATFNYSINNSLLAIQGKSNSDAEFIGCVFNSDPMFYEESKGYFLLSSGSAAVDIGDLVLVQDEITNLGTDLKGDSRMLDGKPDAGVYELIP